MNFEISVELRGRELLVNVLLAGAEECNIEFAYYLYDVENKILQKQMYTKETNTTFLLEEKGSYYVRVFVQGKETVDGEYWKKAKNSRTVDFYGIDFEQEYKVFLENHRSVPQYKLPFSKSEKPKQDILLARIPKISKLKLKALSDLLELKYHEIDSKWKNCLVTLSGEEVHKFGEREVLFSGIGKVDDRLIYGMQDICDMETADALSEQIGTFWMLRKKNNTVILETDYFGLEKIYYYSMQGIFLASNRVHLLLLAMKELELERIPNYQKIYAYLPLNNQLFMQNFSKELNVKDVLTLPVDSRIYIDLKKDKVSIEKTELYYTLSEPLKYDETIYQELLHKAAEEIISNAKAVLEHPLFDKYIVHVTGGLDSRTVYCALTRFPEYRDKMIAVTSVAQHSQEDAEIALKVVSKWPVSMGPIPLREPVPDKEDQTLRSLSFILGTTAEITRRGRRLPYKNTFVLNGFYGEIVARNYYTRGKYDSMLGDSTVTDERCFSQTLENAMKHTVFKIDDCIEQNFVKEVISLPGRTNLEKYENHYLYYRNGLHCNICHNWDMAPEWGILQSKSMLKLKYMVLPLEYGIRLQLDLMYLLNSEITSLEYQAEKNENDRAELHKLYGKYPKNAQYDRAQFDRSKQQWLENQEHLNKHQDPDAKIGKVLNQAEALNILHYLYKHLNLHPDVVREMYRYICYGEPSGAKERFLVKLYSLYFEFTV